MIVTDPIPFWTEPRAITEWGQQCQPTIAPAWLDYINFQLHPDQFTVFYRIIFPAFVVAHGMTLLDVKANGFSEQILLEFSKNSPSLELFEQDFNTFKVYDLFPHAEVADEKSFEIAAHLLKRSWEITLATMFPGKTFEVIMSNTDKDYGPTVTFFQRR